MKMNIVMKKKTAFIKVVKVYSDIYTRLLPSLELANVINIIQNNGKRCCY